MGNTFADHLRALPDADLAALIRLRPDLILPVPVDLSALATRAQSRLSVARAIDVLDRFALEILDGLRLIAADSDQGRASVDELLAIAAPLPAGVEAKLIRSTIGRLRTLCLVWGRDDAIALVASLDEVCGPYPAGLGRTAAELDELAADLVGDPSRLRRELLAAPPAATVILERLAGGPPVGTIRWAQEPPDSPIAWLTGHHLLVGIADDAVELPREVASLLRRRQPDAAGALGVLHPAPPDIAGDDRPLDAIDSAGAGQAMEAVRQIDALLSAISEDPLPALRSGGLGVRELRRLARLVDVEEQTAGLLIEVASAAGLLGQVDGETNGPDERFLPTMSYDSWRAGRLAQRWELVVRAWVAMPREPALIGTRDDRDRLTTALAPDVERIYAAIRRAAALDVLAGTRAGLAVDAESITAQLAWRAPRRSAEAAEPSRWTLAGAAMLGLTGLGALTSYGRLLLAEVQQDIQRDAQPGRDPDPLGVRALATATPTSVEALDALLPEPIDHVLIQADLTIVVPGPPESKLAAELALVAEHESTGGASVYRVTPQGVRRALDAGLTASELHALFAHRSRTPVPQALTYLVDDVARRHGGLRVGSTGCYLRSDDEALLGELLADKRVAGLALRRVAPTVLVSAFASARVLPAIREAGYAPVPEDATGAAVLTRPKSRRAPARPPARVAHSTVDGRAQLSGPRLAGIVEQMRRGDAAVRDSRRVPDSVRTASHAGPGAAAAHTRALAVLQEAVRAKHRVWVGYVDAHGATASRLVRPVSLGAGYLRAEDDRTETLHTFALHRITAAEVADSAT